MACKEGGATDSEDMPAVEKDDRVSRWLLLCGVIAQPVVVVFVIAASLVTPGYSHLSETVSQLGIHGRPHPEVMNTGFIIYGLLINGFAYGLYRRLGRHTGAKAVWLLLGIFGTGILLSGIFQDDPRALSAVTTMEGALHPIFAVIAFLAVVIGVVVFARIVYLNPAWRGFMPFSVAIVVLNLVLSVMFLIEALDPVHGLIQRCLFAISMVWIEAVSLRSLRLSSSTGVER